MRSVLLLTKAEILSLVRSRQAVFWSLLSPVLFMLLFGSLFDARIGSLRGNGRYVDFLMPGIVAMGLMQIGVFSALEVVFLRERGALRFMLTAVPPWTILAAGVGVRLLIGVTQLGLIAATAVVAFSYRPPAGSVVALPIVIAGGLTFAAVGFLVGSLVDSVEACRGVVQVLNLVMMFLGGVFWPVRQLPGELAWVAQLLPITYAADLLRGALAGLPREYPILVSVGVLLIWGVGSVLLGSLRFRVEPRC
jgi:ABC-2 type transport system permease protein